MRIDTQKIIVDTPIHSLSTGAACDIVMASSLILRGAKIIVHAGSTQAQHNKKCGSTLGCQECCSLFDVAWDFITTYGTNLYTHMMHPCSNFHNVNDVPKTAPTWTERTRSLNHGSNMLTMLCRSGSFMFLSNVRLISYLGSRELSISWRSSWIGVGFNNTSSSGICSILWWRTNQNPRSQDRFIEGFGSGNVAAQVVVSSHDFLDGKHHTFVHAGGQKP